jgi:hypothetical protein
MAMPPPQAGAQPAAQPGAQPPGGAMQQSMNPQQVKQMQLVVKQCMQLLLQDQTAAMIVAKAKQEPPAQVLASIVGPLLSRVAESAKEAGAEVDMVTMMVAGVQVLGLLAEMLFHADVLPNEQDMVTVVAEASKIAVQQHNANAMKMQGAGQPPGAPPAPGGAPQPPAGGMISQGV